MARHYKNIGELIAEIERDAKIAEAEAERLSRGSERGLTRQERLGKAANRRGWAFAHRQIAATMRNAFIGLDPGSAKPLAECR